MQIHAAWREASVALKVAVNDEAKLEAQLLLEYVLNVNHAWLITHANNDIDSEVHQQLNALIERRIAGEPIAYIVGQREFYGLALKVTPNTLIPRPDTETLVDAALAKIPLHTALHILDLGTGSGAIALAIAKHRPQANVIAIDASKAALQVAQDNCVALNLSNINFVLSDWFSALDNQRFDCIVSNPPYIESNDLHLSQGDLRFEPTTALASGADGLDDIRHIISKAGQYLHPNGWLILEHGYNQAQKVANLLQLAEFNQISHFQDLAGIQRVTIASL